jgi:trehalose/maltose hydrolase-like predicted phosphorylase
VTLAAPTQTPPAPASFRLSATAADFGHYFPTYLANGYFSTMSAPRGTESNRAYMVAFMDYTPGDISRPAAIPGWNGIDYADGHAWLNKAPLDATHFAGYRQTLDMHDGTLNTRYRWVDGDRASDIRVTTFVSQADRHLAATQLTLTPHFSGIVTLRFPLRLWSAPQHRFAMAKLDFAQVKAAVTASGQNLKAKPPATADRAAIWYPGATHITYARGDAQQRTLAVDGQAAHGLRMAMAAAIGLPKGVADRAIGIERTSGRLLLSVHMRVQRGHVYRFGKFIAASREGWGGDARADMKLAMAARTQGFDALRSRHVAAWHRLWRSDIVIDGDPVMQKAVHSDLFYLLENTTVGTSWPMAACAFSPNYAGHAFWDSDSWVFPALLLFHPQRARPILAFRERTLPQAKARARAAGRQGAKYPWEADPQKGTDQTPHLAWQAAAREIHVNADVAIAQWQYYLISGDTAWLKRHGWPVIRAVATYWASRVNYDKHDHRYHIRHVVSPDEDYQNVTDDTFTNAAARKALRIAVRAAQVVGATPDPRWARIAAHMAILYTADGRRHEDFDPSTPHNKRTWMGSSLAWLTTPPLDMTMSPSVRRADFAYALSALKTNGDDPNDMLITMLSVDAATLGDTATAYHWLKRNLVGFLKPPFNVRSETAGNNVGYILATSAGFVQNFVYGFTGLRIEGKGVVQRYPPQLPKAWHSLTLKGVHLHGQRYDIVVRRDAQGHVRLRRVPAPAHG